MLFNEFESVMNRLKEISLFDRGSSDFRNNQKNINEISTHYVFARDAKFSNKIDFLYLYGYNAIMVADGSKILVGNKIEIDNENFDTRKGTSVLLKLSVNNFVIGFVDVIRLNPEKPSYMLGREYTEDE